jgi:hypothetical protein
MDQTRVTMVPASGRDIVADTAVAWTGVSSSTRPIPVRIEAASLRGQVTRFEVLFPWSRPRGFSQPPPPWNVTDSVWLLIQLVFFPAMPLLGWFNWKRGRTDVRSALRLGVWAAVLSVFVSLMLDVQQWGFPTIALAYFTSYLALEPWTRRSWPHVMVTWARVLAGRLRDPLVGRDLLVVTACVTLNHLAQRLISYAAGWYLDPGTGPTQDADFGFALDTLFGGRIMAARLAGSVLAGLAVAFMFFAVLFAARALFKRHWLAVIVFFAVWGPVNSAAYIADGDWASVVEWSFELGFLAFLIMPYGLFAATVFSTLSQLIDWSILTNDFGAWYGQSSLLATVILIAIAVYGVYAALGGRPFAAFVGDAASP